MRYIQDPNNPRRRIEISDDTTSRPAVAPSRTTSNPSYSTPSSTYSSRRSYSENGSLPISILCLLAFLICFITFIVFASSETLMRSGYIASYIIVFISALATGALGLTSTILIIKYSDDYDWDEQSAPSRVFLIMSMFLAVLMVLLCALFYTAGIFAFPEARAADITLAVILYILFAAQMIAIFCTFNSGYDTSGATKAFSGIAIGVAVLFIVLHLTAFSNISPPALRGQITATSSRSSITLGGSGHSTSVSFEISVTGGSGNFRYQFSASLESPNFSVPAQREGASPQTFSVQRTRSAHSSATLTVTITDLNYRTVDRVTITIITQPDPPPPPSCFVTGTLVTLADGSQVPVEKLRGDELLLVWNFHTGSFDSAPIIFIDSAPEHYFEIIDLRFAGNSYVRIIYEHGFWNFTLNRFVWITAENARNYIGHYFKRHVTEINGELAWERVRLLDVNIYHEYTVAWSPVTFSHFSLYVNSLFSVPGATQVFLNIFEVEPNTMRYCMEFYYNAIEEFGLLSFEEFNEVMPDLLEVFFQAFNGRYFRISMGKGLLSWDDLFYLIDRYAKFLVV